MTSTHERMVRLAQLRGLLAAGDAVAVRELARELAVSPRTLFRDIDLLRDQGFAIEADRGRGGGVRLARGHYAGSVELRDEEAVDLLLSLALAERAQSPILGAIAPLRRKLSALFAANARGRIGQIRQRLLIGPPASTQVLASYRSNAGGCAPEVRRAFTSLKLLEITYRDSHGKLSRRTVEPHVLLLNPPAWYLCGWDELRSDVRSFRFDRIVDATCLDRSCPRRNLALFKLNGEAASA